MTYIAYLDEFGHIGPYVARNDRRHNDSPVSDWRDSSCRLKK